MSVQGRYMVDSNGERVQLRGVSFGWHNWWHRYFNEAAVTKMAKEWRATVVRCSIGLNLDDNCYDKNPQLAYATVDSMVNAAVKNGIYVIVDFHSHENNLPLAKEFFGVVSKKYGNIPNIIYEIWNEPLEVEWAETKAYSEKLIPVIRENAPDAIVIVPTPRWDQDVDKAADDPITKLRDEFQEQFDALKASFESQAKEMESTITKLKDENDSLHRALIRSAVNPQPVDTPPKSEEDIYNDTINALAEKTKRLMSLRS